MARSSLVVVALLLAACSQTTPAPAIVTTAPAPKVYTCAQEKQLAVEYRALPDGSILVTVLDDYRLERKALAAARKEPPPRCRP